MKLNKKQAEVKLAKLKKEESLLLKIIEDADKEKDIKLRIKGFDDILLIAKEKGYKYKPNKNDSIDEIAEKKIKLACLVVNEGWIPTKDKQRWFPYFSFSGSSGFDFPGTYCDYANVTAYGGFRLCLKDKETAIFMGKTFPHLYKDMYLNIEY